jgi:hypothetical protein
MSGACKGAQFNLVSGSVSKYWTRVQVAGSEKRTSLLHQCVFYSGEKIYGHGPTSCCCK